MTKYLYRLTVRRERVAESPILPGGPACSSDVAARLLRILFDELDREQCAVLLLDVKNRAVGFNVVSVGSLAASVVHPREVFVAALLANAAAVIMGHNHPSGDPTPSAEDRRITDRCRKAGDVLGIPLLDHVIIGEGDSYFSFSDNGW